MPRVVGSRPASKHRASSQAYGELVIWEVASGTAIGILNPKVSGSRCSYTDKRHWTCLPDSSACLTDHAGGRGSVYSP